MDSGNTSGSIQSSSGNDDEYDSRAAADPHALLFTTTPQNDAVQQNPFDPLPNFFDYPAMAWPRPERSDPIPNPTQPDLIPTVRSPLPSFPPSIQTPPSVSGPTERITGKKRSRASRRAPTTVLTTDTTNFRAMVQEFTGIPAPPFTSSPFPRTRFDLFGSGSGSGIRTGHVSLLDHSSPTTGYSLLRPYAQKAQQTASFTGNQNPVLSFNSLLQPPLKFPQPSMVKSSDTAVIQDRQTTSFLNPLANWNTAPANVEFGVLSSNDNIMSANNNKATENVASRNEGMVESWICSSD